MGTAAITPGLGAGPIHRLLGGCVGVDCSLQGAEICRSNTSTLKATETNGMSSNYHESLLNTKVIMDDFGQGGQAVGGTGGVTINWK